MSAGVCGKRVGFEEIFGSSSSSAKRSRCSGFGSPTRSTEPDDAVLSLLQMFPALDPALVKTVLGDHNNKIDDAIESLRRVSFPQDVERNRSQSHETAMTANFDAAPAPSTSTAGAQKSEEQEFVGVKAASGCDNVVDGSKWVDLFVREMLSATGLDDMRVRAARILEAFEQSVTARSRVSEELELASLKERVQSLLNDNQILKRAVAIQYERNSEQEEKTIEVQNLKLVLNQYQEQVRNLELNNYTLNLHLQRVQQSTAMPGKFHPDIY